MSAVHSRAIFQKRRYPTDRGGLDSAHGHWQNYFHVTWATTQHNAIVQQPSLFAVKSFSK
jgi:hypothetical protein